MKEVIIVPCTKEKIWDHYPDPPSVAAKDAYIKSAFKQWREHAEKSGSTWFILSTKYGLIKPEHPIENYEVSVSDALANEAFRRKLQTQGETLLRNFEKVILLDWEKFEPLVKYAIGNGKAQYELKRICY